MEQSSSKCIDPDTTNNSRHAELLKSCFGGKENAYAVQQSNGKYIKLDEKVSYDLLKRHVDGKTTIAVYPVVDISDCCQWGMIDFDSKSPKCVERMLWIKAYLAHIGINSLIEPSGLKGYHLWVLFKGWIPAYKAQRLLRWVAKKAEEEFDRPDYMVEINPKQASGDGYGNAAKLPWGIHRMSGETTYFVDDALQILPNLGADAVEAIPKISEELLDEILEEWLPPENVAPLGEYPQQSSDLLHEVACSKLEQNCAFIGHCRDHAETLSEPLWWTMVSQLSFFGIPGEKRAHELSMPYPLYSERETQQKIDNARRKKAIGPQTCEYIRRDLGFWCPDDCIAKRIEVGSPVGMARKLAAQERIRSRTRSVDVATSKGGKQTTLVNCHQLALEIMSDYEFKTFSDNEEMLVYCDGVYRPKGQSIIKKEVETRLEYLNTIHRTKEVVNHIITSTYADRNIFNEDTDRINLKNGILNIRTQELHPHSPDFLSTIQIPVEYDPDAVCPKIDKFLADILPLDSIPIIAEFAGYCLHRAYPIHSAVMLLGDGSNGKSTLLELFKAFLGADNCSRESIQGLQQRFGVSPLYGKLANICGDIPSTALNHTGMFKMLTGGDTIRGEEKYKNPFSFNNHAKLIFSANKPPPIGEEDSFAFWRRWIILNFPNQFTGDKADKQLIKKLTTPEELSGFLNLALDGLSALLERGDFSYYPTPDEVSEMYIKASDPVYAFVTDRCSLHQDYWITTEDLYKAFLEYCADSNTPKLTKESFGRAIRGGRLSVGINASRRRVNGELRTGFAGITLK